MNHAKFNNLQLGDVYFIVRLNIVYMRLRIDFFWSVCNNEKL
jgi:hypothetical protein